MQYEASYIENHPELKRSVNLKELEEEIQQKIIKLELPPQLFQLISLTSESVNPSIKACFNLVAGQNNRNEQFSSGKTYIGGVKPATYPVDYLVDYPTTDIFAQVASDGKIEFFRQTFDGWQYRAIPENSQTSRVSDSLRNQAFDFIEKASEFYHSPNYQKALEFVKPTVVPTPTPYTVLEPVKTAA